MTKETQAPDDWEVVRLGEIADIDRGLSWAREQESPVSQDAALPVVRIGNVQPQGFQMDDILYIRGVKEAERSRRSITSRTLVMVGSNGNRERVGNTLLANQQVIGHLLASFLIGIHPRNDVSERFLFSSLRSAKTQGLITESTAGSTGLKNLSLTWLRNFQVNLPPLPEQRAIAAVLDSIDEAIERTEAVIAATERLRDALLHELLTRGVPGWHSEWKEAPGIGTVPACWKVVRLGDVAELVTSGSRAWSRYFRPGGALFVRSQNISVGTIDRSDAVFVQPPTDAEAVRTRIQRGDLLVSITGEPGKVTVADDTLGQAYVSQHVALVRLNDGDLSDCAGEFLRGRAGQNQFRGMAYGQTRPGLSLINVNDAKVAIPPPTERAIIGNVGKSFQRAIKETRSERERLRLLKVSAADALLTGRTRARA